MTIAPLETRYAGCRFRSRLEARWAVLFDALRIPWQYEPQGYQIGEQTYLPDFYLPQSKTWVEVKGSEEDFLERGTLYSAAASGGLPGTDKTWGTDAGLLVLGPMPHVQPGEMLPTHTLLQHDAEGLRRSFAAFHSLRSLQIVATWDGPVQPPELPERRGLPFVATSGYPPADVMDHAARAYIAANSARFEHGARG